MSDETGRLRDDAASAHVTGAAEVEPRDGVDRLDDLDADFGDDAEFEPQFDETITEQQVVVQRQPRIWRFMLLGGIVFALAAIIVTYSMPYDAATATYDRNVVAGFVVLFAAATGLALGGLIAIALERLTRRRAVTLTAEHIEARPRDDVDRD